MVEDSRVPMLRHCYSAHLNSPEHVVLEMDQYLPLCYQHNQRFHLLSVSVNEYLTELPGLIRFHGTAKETLEERIDEMAKETYLQFPDYREQTDIVRLVESVSLMLLNVGDELFHKLHEHYLYSHGGFHHYEFERSLNPTTIVLRKMAWPRLINAVMNPGLVH